MKPTLPAQHLATPAPHNGTGVLVLSGSSGRVESARADLLATTGALALTYQWFGGSGVPDSINEFPLEEFAAALDLLEPECERLVLFGASKTAEAFLVYAALDPRVDAVIAVGPTSHVWANVGPDAAGNLRPQRSSWSWQGQPLPFVPYDDDYEVTGDPPVFAPSYEHSLRQLSEQDPRRCADARIPVERIFADVLLIAGGDDQVWPSLAAAREIDCARKAVALPTTLVSRPDAGHRVALPGEQSQVGGIGMARGGNPDADRALGASAWPHIERVLTA